MGCRGSGSLPAPELIQTMRIGSSNACTWNGIMILRAALCTGG